MTRSCGQCGWPRPPSRCCCGWEGGVSWTLLTKSAWLLEVNVQLDELEMLERQVERLDERIAELYSEVDSEQRLMKIGGLGEFLSAAITASPGADVRGRFPSTKHAVSIAGLAPRGKSSPGHIKPGQGITKRGNS